MITYSWTQPICEICFTERYPDKYPVRMILPEVEQCVDCEDTTDSGIYIRVDPKEAKYPSREREG